MQLIELSNSVVTLVLGMAAEEWVELTTVVQVLVAAEWVMELTLCVELLVAEGVKLTLATAELV